MLIRANSYRNHPNLSNYTPKKAKAYSALFKRLLSSMELGHLHRSLIKANLVGVYSLLFERDIPICFTGKTEVFSRQEALKKDLLNSLKRKMLSNAVIKEPISVNTYFTALNFMLHFVRIDRLKEFPWVESAFEKIKKVNDELMTDALLGLTEACWQTLVPWSDFRTVLFSYDFCFERAADQDVPLRIVVKVHEAQTKEFVLESKPRKAYRVASTSVRDGKKEVTWGSYFYRNREYPIYIQGHAIEALVKRVDSIRLPILRHYLIRSVEKCELHYYKGKYLLDFMYNKTKVGYFVCSFVSGCIVLRTFLFITHDGTPEGELLNKELELNKNTKDYLGMSKLSSYRQNLEEGVYKSVFETKGW